jgi:hypothetical protein
MRCFSILAEKTIRTSADGRRMLALYGRFARPYDVSSPDTEERVIRRLAGAYRVLTIPALALLVFLSHRSDAHSLFGGLTAALVAGWLIVWLFLHRELRWLRRVEPSARDRACSAELVSRLRPADRALLRRRRRFLLSMFLVCCLYGVIGVAMVFFEPALGYFTAVFFGWCAVRWWGVYRLPAEAVLEMRSNWFFDRPHEDVRSQARPWDCREAAKPVAAQPELSPFLSTVWNRELDAQAFLHHRVQ